MILLNQYELTIPWAHYILYELLTTFWWANFNSKELTVCLTNMSSLHLLWRAQITFWWAGDELKGDQVQSRLRGHPWMEEQARRCSERFLLPNKDIRFVLLSGFHFLGHFLKFFSTWRCETIFFNYLLLGIVFKKINFKVWDRSFQL